MTQTTEKKVLVIENGSVLFEGANYGDAWAFCTGLKHPAAEIFKVRKMRPWSPDKSPVTHKKK